MGLDATVYRRIEELPFTKEDLRLIAVDPRTGQVDFADVAMDRAWSSKVKAVEKRIGNIAMVHFLRAELEAILASSGSDTVLIGKVLNNGVHAGDILSLDDLGSLRNEIALVRRIVSTELSPEVESFFADMEELADASERHRNPIVFE